MMRNKINSPILDKVLFIGPDKNCIGGIASVLSTYSHNFEPFHYLSTNSRKGKVSGYIRLIVTLLSLPKERFNGRKILHIHYGAGKSFLRKRIVMSLGHILGFKIVGHSHSGHFKTQVSKKGKNKLRRQLRHIDSHVVLTDYWSRFFDETLDLKANVINNIVNHADSESLNIDSSKPLTLYYLGRLNEKKGVTDLLDAISIVSNSNPNIRLIIGGDGEQRSLIIQKISDLKLNNIVDYRGPLNFEECQKVISESDVMVLPSYIEGLPISILEAFEYSRPVITTGVGGIPNLVKDGYNGIIVNPGDVNGLSDAIISLEKDRDKIKQMGINGKISLSPYYPENVLKSLISVYEHLLKHN